MMQLPFNTQQFLEIFSSYNNAIYPAQYVFYLLGLLVVYFALIPTAKTSIVISGILAFLWIWMGAVYHILFFTGINKAAYLLESCSFSRDSS